MKTIFEIARLHKPVKQYLRPFLKRYDSLFGELRNEPLTVLEIGIGGYKSQNKGGNSLRMWADYFHNSTIIGLDVQYKKIDLPDNVIIECGSQTDIELLNSLLEKYNGFDIIIDDASHITVNTIMTFEALNKFTRLFYIVEDLHMRSSRGTKEYFQNIPGVDFDTLNLCVISK